VFLAKFGIATALMVPLYLSGQVVPLGIASTLLGTPALGVCTYVCWRILRADADPAGPDGRTPTVIARSRG
jgi:hypothetical protein